MEVMRGGRIMDGEAGASVTGAVRVSAGMVVL
jgi:hypothetical protein